MKKIYSVILVALLISVKAFSFQKEWVALKELNPDKCKPALTTLAGDQSQISIQLPGFYKQEIKTPAGNAYTISLPGAAKMLNAGMPDLPQLTFSLIIPDAADMKAEVIFSQYTDYNFSIAPSKGNLKRNIDPSQVPFTYSSAYSINEFIPSSLTSLRDPYILRDFRGQTVVVNPFQYNPVTQTLRVYYSMTIKISPSGNVSTKNIFNRQQPVSTLDATFAGIYQNHFMNFNPATYSPVFDHGKMLVITDALFLNAIKPFVNWKNRMGQPTELVDVATIGTTPQDIKTYIENYYHIHGLTFVLLVGDGPQIPPYPSQYGDSDPSYGYLIGTDSYAEVFVGRFSANNVDELATQVQRSLTYEMYPDPNGQWYHKAVCIGSDQGPGDDNEMDFEHERNIRADYLAYNYTVADELYDGSQGVVDQSGNPIPADLNTSLNDGRSIITYTGHGSQTSFGTTGYDISDITALSNNDKLPFIWSVACVNGDFNNGTCFAEGLMRATMQSGKATGAIATFMSTINQSWDPPMDGQDEMVDILVESYPGNIKHTFGGISVNGCMHMNDQYGSAGDEMTDTWTTFGDPSLMVRTNTPAPLTVTHDPIIYDTQTSFFVNCNKDGAEICLSLNNQIVGVGWSLLGIALLNPVGLHVGDTLDLVVTAYNTIPYFSKVIVVANTTGIVSIANQSFSIYPNPTNGNVTISLKDNMKNVSIRFINSLGQTVFSKNCLNEISSYEVDLNSVSKGVYTLVISNDTETFGTQKIIKE